jgi:uncharacterized membrane protein
METETKKVNTKKVDTKKLAVLGILTAIVIVLQVLAVLLRPTGFFSISLVLIPIVVGASLYGPSAGAWLGFVFSVVVLINDAAAFLAINAPGTFITVLVKGTVAGLCAALAYKLIEKVNSYLAVVIAAIVCPVVNTGIFCIGCRLFFWDTVSEWAKGAGFESATTFLFVGLIGINFLIEMGINMVLSPVIVRLVNIGKNKRLH